MVESVEPAVDAEMIEPAAEMAEPPAETEMIEPAAETFGPAAETLESPVEVVDTNSEDAGTSGEVETVEPDVAFVLSGLEEPALDDGGSLIVGSLDDEGLAASRPVILGAYGDESAGPAVSEVAIGQDTTSEIPAEVGSESHAAEAVETVATPAESDFIVLDDAPAASVPDLPGLAAPSNEDAPQLSNYTCDDCVYVDTCPNKDERKPEDVRNE